jgi:1-acyl-sn-glycerol-3-phosphate acyltransferase
MNVFGNFSTLFATRFFSHWGWFLSRVGSISIENKVRKQGQTEMLVNKFKHESIFKLFMSPKGTSSRASWRTGYYYLANQLKCPIIVCGLDYNCHRVLSSDAIEIKDKSINEVKSICTSIFSYIPQLYPGNDPDVDYYKKRVSILSHNLISYMGFILILMIMILLTIYVGHYFTWIIYELSYITLAKYIDYDQKEAPIAMISYFAYMILRFMKFKAFNMSYLSILNTYPKGVLVMSHTSYWDFFIFVLYKLSYPNIFRSFYIVVAGRFFNNKLLSVILTYFGCIPGNQTHDTKSGGITTKIVDQLKDKEKFHLMLSPKGGITKLPWRSGYYYIAKMLNVPIAVVGIDYKLKCLKIAGVFTHLRAIEDLQPKLQETMSQITPHNIQYGYY